ncbi:alpha/beta hydrolase family protein [Pseudomonas sp. 5P_3.1_Bac2]|uniref:alpha/beta hydrolase family protein n=1 Tax=Pseudomonas sp. 5P_3.1_Bac2 TaxID=2971617 RepID=UPI0021C71D07|nr:alpha/beta hydrolase family protein [Pseudomonas sp. 5P_3.1_Bac2]MCU1717516.1 alpha/beta hydrolase family protein [Pseudomonas sp. 5P_3.1_Bac2]
MSHRPRHLLLCLLVTALSSAAAYGEEAPDKTATNPANTSESDAAPAPAAAPEVVRAPLPERSQAEAEALEQQLEAKQQQQLQGADESFLALWLPANVAEPSGVVVLLPGSEESADDPRSIGPLRHKLPDGGWHSLSLSLPSPASDIPLQRPAPQTPTSPQPAETEQPASEASAKDETPAEPAPADAQTDTSPDKTVAVDSAKQLEEQRSAYSQRVMARIDAGLKFAAEHNAQSITLLGHGSGAYWAARYLQEHKEAKVQQLIALDAQLPAGFTPPLDELLPALQLSTADLFNNNEPLSSQAARKRLQASKRLQHPSYTQIALKALPGNPPVAQEQTYRRIRGWLSEQAKTPKK